MPETSKEHSEVILPLAVDLATAAALGVKAEGAEVIKIESTEDQIGLPKSVPALLVRGDSPDVKSVNAILEQNRLHPARKVGTAGTQTLASFIELTKRHKTEDSAVFANMDWKAPSFTAVIDYHEKANGGKAAFGKHRIHYKFPLSEEWQAWIGSDGVKMIQEDFAHFLEDRIPDLASPTDIESREYEAMFGTSIATPAKVVELSRGLQINVAAKVKNAQTLQTGEGSIQWEEEHQNPEGKPLKVPGLFMLNIAPFFMGNKVRVPVRLRYRASGGNIIWFYQIYRPDQFITERLRTDLFDVRAATELPAFEGNPEMQA